MKNYERAEKRKRTGRCVIGVKGRLKVEYIVPTYIELGRRCEMSRVGVDFSR